MIINLIFLPLILKGQRLQFFHDNHTEYRTMFDMMKMMGKMKEVQARMKEAQDNLVNITGAGRIRSRNGEGYREWKETVGCH